MERIGIRELKLHLSAALHRVADGETLEVTDHGHAIARIVPLRPGGIVDQMIAEGRLIPPEDEGDLWEDDIPPGLPGEPLLSEILSEMRSDER